MGFFQDLGKSIFGDSGQAAPTGVDMSQYAPQQNEAASSKLQNVTTANNSKDIQDALQKYSSGQMSLPDLQKLITNSGVNGGGNMAAVMSDPVASQKLIQDMVNGDPTQSRLTGPGSDSLLSQSLGNYKGATGDLSDDRKALSGNDPSYGLQASDLAAYGQASGNIGRMFGDQGNSLAQSLADRGLSAGPSGSAVAGFSGLAGSQNEQLAGLQNQIAQQRIQTAQQLATTRTNADLQRQGQAGTLAGGLGQQYQGALQNQFGRSNTAADNAMNGLTTAAEAAQANQALGQNIGNAQFNQTQSTKNTGLAGAIGSGINAGVSSGISSAIGGGSPDKKTKGSDAASLASSFGAGSGGVPLAVA